MWSLRNMPYDDDRFDGVALVNDDGAALMCRVARASEQFALGVGGKVGEQADVVHAR